MRKDPSHEKSLKGWTDLFAEPAASLLTLAKGNLVEPGLSTPQHLALWLEFFLIAGEGPVKERWGLLPLEDQITLGIELLKCYLFQPLYIRLSKGEKSPVIKSPLSLESRGKLFQIEHGTETKRKTELLYPLDHHRFWPELFRLFTEDFFSSQKVLKALEPALSLMSPSRLRKMRQRAETLQALFLKRDHEVIPRLNLSERTEQLKSKPTVVEENSGPTKQSTPQRKKKKKSSPEQLELF